MVSDLLQNSIFQVDFRSFKIVDVKIILTSVSRFCKYWLWSSNWWFNWFQFSSVAQSCPTPWTAARQACLSITNSQSSPKLMSIESVMPSSHLILCHSLLLLPPIPPSIRVFSNDSTLCMRWPKYWSFSFSISPSSDFGAPKNKVWHCFYCFSIYFPWSGSVLLNSEGL